MSTNRFEQVDEAPEDALTLLIGMSNGALVGAVNCPAAATQGRLPKDYASGAMSGKEAISSAIKLANELKVAVVVMDPQNVWPKEWGELYRVED